MEFKNEYLGSFYQDEEYEKAQLLWLWYDYHTEVFDRSIWGSVPSKYDETMATLTTPLAHSESNRNAIKIRKHIYEIATRCNISNSTMHKAKTDRSRNARRIQFRIDIYLKLDKLGEFNFIHE